MNYKVKDKNQIVRQISDLDHYGYAHYQIISDNGVKITKNRPVKTFHTDELRDLPKRGQYKKMPAKASAETPFACPKCGTHNRMGYQIGVACPNCDYISSFNEWFQARKWLETTEDEFMKHHKTGWIPSDAYERYEADGGLSWLGPKSKYALLVSSKKYGEDTIEFRKKDEKLKYTATDKDGDIVRDEKGMATYMTDDEIAKEGLATHEQTIVAFAGDKPIGMASNEFGTIGVWVEKSYQKKGIGSDLMVMFMEQNKKWMKGTSKIGQMTNAGENMSRSAYRKLAKKYGPDFDKS